VGEVGKKPHAMSDDTRAGDMTYLLQDYLLAYEPDHLRLLLWVARQAVRGHPLLLAEVDQRIAELEPDAAQQTLCELTEQDVNGEIVGAMGLSLRDEHPQCFFVADVSLSTLACQRQALPAHVAAAYGHYPAR
jgi:hypothetical protein